MYRTPGPYLRSTRTENVYLTPYLMKPPVKVAVILLLFLSCHAHCFARKRDTDEARHVIERFAGRKLPVNLSLSLGKADGCDRYEYTAKSGRLHLKGSSGVALCKGFYDYLKFHKAGISSWSGNRCDLPSRMPDAPVTAVTSPFRHHYYFNVVTYGYSMPYWNWERWEREIDWMALHGIDMPLALVANEAISARVWKKLGLTDTEINAYFVGPAHFPWMRMGNISGIDGPLPASWHAGQIALQHRILQRMKALGMKPICPGFAGFVPQAIKRCFPDAELTETSWCGGAFHNWMLAPDHPLFRRIGQLFIEEWEKEFGPNEYYIADSFNEMDIPFPPHGAPERYRLLADYGKAVYESIRAGNPKATWVMQGWMFGFQRNIWDPETLQALLSHVPDNRMLLLDLAVDYNYCFWHNGANWDFYQGFFGKPWVYSVIPNMGGKSGLTGKLDFYANGRLEALRSPDRGRLHGYGMAPEGIENNEVIYELVTDGGWTADSIDLNRWLDSYSRCRYGTTTPDVTSCWDGLRRSVYGTFTDHPRYNWQFRPGRVHRGSIHADSTFFAAIESLSQAIPELQNSPLFVTDMVEMTAQYLGGKMELLLQAADQAFLIGDTLAAEKLEAEFITLAKGQDRLLASHPTLRLDNWLEYARRWGDTPALRDYYERNARRIVTIWGPPVDDYSARIWSGLIRDYYLPRWQHYFESRRTGKAFDFAAWERKWVEGTTGLSPVRPYEEPLKACIDLLQKTYRITPAILTRNEHEQIGQWTPAEMSREWKVLTWNVPVEKLSSLHGVWFRYSRGWNKLEIKEVSLEIDERIAARVVHPGETGIADRDNAYLFSRPFGEGGNNSCRLHAVVRSDGLCDSYGRVLLLSR